MMGRTGVTRETQASWRRPRVVPEPWARAREIDPSLNVFPRHLAALARRELRPTAFSRDLLFSALAKGEPVLFEGLPVPVRGQEKLGDRQAVLRALAEGFPRREKVCVRCGPSATRRSIPVAELLRRWESGRARVSVTDMHIRGSDVMRRIDCSRLSNFNLLPEGDEEVAAQEMLTMVVSSAGTFSDSHTDDPDGSNHCFVGKKLWLAWDTFEGFARGLEDVERWDVAGDQAAFNMAAFLSVPGSRWFTVGPGQTLFLPGHLTHKVITLEGYLGVGSFSVSLPSYLRTLIRWTRHTPLWARKAAPAERLALVDEITRLVIDKLRVLRRAPPNEQRKLGLPYLLSALQELQQGPPGRLPPELRRPMSGEFLKAAAGLLPRGEARASSPVHMPGKARSIGSMEWSG